MKRILILSLAFALSGCEAMPSGALPLATASAAAAGDVALLGVGGAMIWQKTQENEDAKRNAYVDQCSAHDNRMKCWDRWKEARAHDTYPAP